MSLKLFIDEDSQDKILVKLLLQALHLADRDHPGILVVYHQADFAKNMSYKAILKAIANLEASGVPLANQFISLNHWNY